MGIYTLQNDQLKTEINGKTHQIDTTLSIKKLRAFEHKQFIEPLAAADQNSGIIKLPRYNLEFSFAGQQIFYQDRDQIEYEIQTPEADMDLQLGIYAKCCEQPEQGLLLIPVQQFYRDVQEESICKENPNYLALYHDHSNQVARENINRLYNKKEGLWAYNASEKYIIYQYNKKDGIKANAPADQIYLAYLYCGHFNFVKAFNLLKNCRLQGTIDEARFLYWLLTKLPTPVNTHNDATTRELQLDRFKEIDNSEMLAVRMQALCLLAKLKMEKNFHFPPAPKYSKEQDLTHIAQTVAHEKIAYFYTDQKQIDRDPNIVQNQLTWNNCAKDLLVNYYNKKNNIASELQLSLEQEGMLLGLLPQQNYTNFMLNSKIIAYHKNIAELKLAPTNNQNQIAINIHEIQSVAITVEHDRSLTLPLNNISQETTADCLKKLTLAISDEELLARFHLYYEICRDQSSPQSQNNNKIKQFCEDTFKVANASKTRQEIMSLLYLVLHNQEKFPPYQSLVAKMQTKNITAPTLGELFNDIINPVNAANKIKYPTVLPKYDIFADTKRLLPFNQPSLTPKLADLKPSANVYFTANLSLELQQLLKEVQNFNQKLATQRDIFVNTYKELSSDLLFAEHTSLFAYADEQNCWREQKMEDEFAQEFIKKFKDINIDQQIEYLIKQYKDEQANIKKIKNELVENANKLPNDLQSNIEIELRNLGKLRTITSLQDCLNLYLQENSANYRARDIQELKQIYQNTNELLKKTEEIDKINRLLTGAKKLKKNMQSNQTIGMQKVKKFINILSECLPESTTTPSQIFQYKSKMLIRAPQHEILAKLQGEQNLIVQLMMGGGKSKLLLPLLAYQKAKQDNLAMILVPKALLELTYDHLADSLYKLFGREITYFKFERNSPCDEQQLDRYLANLQQAAYNKQCLITSAESMQALQLKYLELLKASKNETKDNDNELIKCKKLAQILKFFKAKGDVIIDEVHAVLDIKKELNYSIGKKVIIPPELQDYSIKFFRTLADINLGEQEGSLKSLANKSIIDILREPGLLANEELLHDLLAFYSQHPDILKLLDPNNIISTQELQAFLLGHSESNIIDQLPPKIKRPFIYVREQFSYFLKCTLKAKFLEKYGPASNYPNDLTAAHYQAANTPSGRVFGNFIEFINYTIQMHYLLASPPKTLVYEALKTLKAEAKKEFIFQQEEKSNSQKIFDSFLPSDEAEDLLSLKLDLNSSNFIILYDKIKNNNAFNDYLLANQILPSITTEEAKARVNTINLIDMFHSVCGFTGTAANARVYHEKLSLDLDSGLGIYSKTKALLTAKKTKITTCPPGNLSFYIQQCLSQGNVRAIIDVGAQLCSLGKNGEVISNEKVATEIAKQLKENKSPIKYVLFFHDENLLAWPVHGEKSDCKILNTTDANKIAEILKCTPDERFTYYDQEHALGTDILQAKTARAVVTIDHHIGISQFLQAVMRMRQFAAKQQATIMMPPSMLDAITDSKNFTDELQNLFEYLTIKENNNLMEDNFQAASKKISNVIRQDLLERLYNSGPEQLGEKFTIYESFFIEYNDLEILNLYAVRNQQMPTEFILTTLKEQILTVWENMVRKTTDMEDAAIIERRQSLTAEINKIIKKVILDCKAENSSRDYAGAAQALELQAQAEQEQQLEINLNQQRIELAIVDVSKASNCKCSNIQMDLKDTSINDPIKILQSFLCTPLKRIIGTDCAKFKIEFDDTIMFSTASLKVIYDQIDTEQKILNKNNSSAYYYPPKRNAKLSNIFNLYKKNIFCVIYIANPYGNSINAYILSVEECEIVLIQIRNKEITFKNHQVWVEDPLGLPILGTKPEQLQQQPTEEQPTALNNQYLRIQEQLQFFNGNIEELSKKEEFYWLPTLDPKLLYDFIRTYIQPYNNVSYNTIKNLFTKVFSKKFYFKNDDLVINELEKKPPPIISLSPKNEVNKYNHKTYQKHRQAETDLPSLREQFAREIAKQLNEIKNLPDKLALVPKPLDKIDMIYNLMQELGKLERPHPVFAAKSYFVNNSIVFAKLNTYCQEIQEILRNCASSPETEIKDRQSKVQDIEKILMLPPIVKQQAVKLPIPVATIKIGQNLSAGGINTFINTSTASYAISLANWEEINHQELSAQQQWIAAEQTKISNKTSDQATEAKKQPQIMTSGYEITHNISSPYKIFKLQEGIFFSENITQGTNSKKTIFRTKLPATKDEQNVLILAMAKKVLLKFDANHHPAPKQIKIRGKSIDAITNLCAALIITASARNINFSKEQLFLTTTGLNLAQIWEAAKLKINNFDASDSKELSDIEQEQHNTINTSTTILSKLHNLIDQEPDFESRKTQQAAIKDSFFKVKNRNDDLQGKNEAATSEFTKKSGTHRAHI